MAKIGSEFSIEMHADTEDFRAALEMVSLKTKALAAAYQEFLDAVEMVKQSKIRIFSNDVVNPKEPLACIEMQN